MWTSDALQQKKGAESKDASRLGTPRSLTVRASRSGRGARIMKGRGDRHLWLIDGTDTLLEVVAGTIRQSTIGKAMKSRNKVPSLVH